MIFSSSPISLSAAGNTEIALNPTTSDNSISMFLVKNDIESPTDENSTQISTIRNTRLDGMPAEAFRRILEFCSSDSLLQLSAVSYYFYFQVIQFFNSEVRIFLSRIPEEYLNLYYIEYLLEPLKENTNEEYVNREIFKNQKRKNLIINALKNDYHPYTEDEYIKEMPTEDSEFISRSTIIKSLDPFINKLFQPGPIFNLKGSKTRILEEDILKENFIRNMIFSRPLLKRGYLAEAANLFFNKNFTNITIEDLKKIGLLHSTETPNLVWTTSSEGEIIKKENPSLTTAIHTQHALFIWKYFFTLCTQIHEPNLTAFLKIPPRYVKKGISACANYNTNERKRLILNDILTSNVFYDDSIYNEINEKRENPLRGEFNAPFFELLLKNHLNIDSLDNYGSTPLDNALIYDDVPAAEFFINHGATVHWRSEYLFCLLRIILDNENNIGEKILFDNQNFSIDTQIKYTKFEIIKLLILNFINIGQEPSTFKLSIFLLYVSLRAKPNTEIEYGNLAQFLMENGADLEIALKQGANEAFIKKYL